MRKKRIRKGKVPKCGGYLDCNNEFDCNYEPDCICEKCVVNGGCVDPLTNKTFKGLKTKRFKQYKKSLKMRRRLH